MSKKRKGERVKGKIRYLSTDTYIALDVETTGLDPKIDKVIEIGAIKVVEGKQVGVFNSLVNPEREIDNFITTLTGITNAELREAPKIKDIISGFYEFIKGDYLLLGHNVSFDINFLYDPLLEYTGKHLSNDYIDTRYFAKREMPWLKNYKLITLAEYFGINNNKAHRALGDCETTIKCYEKLKEKPAPPQRKESEPDDNKAHRALSDCETTVECYEESKEKPAPLQKRELNPDISTGKFCFNCGSPLYGIFCSKCGTKLADVNEQKTPKPQEAFAVSTQKTVSKTETQKQEKPFYKKWWFILIVILVVLGSIGSVLEEDKSAEQPETGINESSQETITLQTLLDDMHAKMTTENPEPNTSEMVYWIYSTAKDNKASVGDLVTDEAIAYIRENKDNFFESNQSMEDGMYIGCLLEEAYRTKDRDIASLGMNTNQAIKYVYRNVESVDDQATQINLKQIDRCLAKLFPDSD